MGNNSSNFNYKNYLENYPDLVATGIHTEEKALTHFINHGKAEGRTYIKLETILHRLLNFNINNKKLEYNCPNLNEIYVPPYGVLLKFTNGDTSILKTNKGSLFGDNIYNHRFIPFYKYLQKLNKGTINLVCIFIYSDTIFKEDNNKIDQEYLNKILQIDLPIFVSSMDKDLYSIAKNIILIPNFYTYSNDIPIDEIIKNDIPFDLKINKGIGAFSSTCWNRLSLKKWSTGKDNIIINLTAAFGPVIPELMDHSTISIQEQLKYKYLISMDGCVTSWNGLLWKMYSNSLVIKEKTNCIEYWYFLLNDQNIIEFEISNMDKISTIINGNNNEFMLKQQQDLARVITSEETTNNYLIGLFNKIKLI
jgi:hypothetical protein